MQNPTFDEAAKLWPRLNSEAVAESDLDDDLHAACERAILSRAIESAHDAALVCQVLLDNIVTGQRSDELDIRAMTALRDWTAKLVAGSALGRTSMFRRNPR